MNKFWCFVANNLGRWRCASCGCCALGRPIGGGRRAGRIILPSTGWEVGNCPVLSAALQGCLSIRRFNRQWRRASETQGCHRLRAVFTSSARVDPYAARTAAGSAQAR